MIAYPIGARLYLNITNRCTNKCSFCIRNFADGVAGHNLRLEKEPTVEEIIEDIGDPSEFEEVVFCGFGEPLIRLDAVKEASTWLVGKKVPVRVDTNGLANLYHGRNILPELKGLVTSISISLNAESSEKYLQICRPVFGHDSYKALLEFIQESKEYIPNVRVSVVNITEINVDACAKIAADLGVSFHVRG